MEVRLSVAPASQGSQTLSLNASGVEKLFQERSLSREGIGGFGELGDCFINAS